MTRAALRRRNLSRLLGASCRTVTPRGRTVARGGLLAPVGLTVAVVVTIALARLLLALGVRLP